MSILQRVIRFKTYNQWGYSSVWRFGSRLVLLSVALLSILFASVSCVHLNRVSGGALERLARNGDHFVLVFGSLSTPGGKLDRPAIRFLHPDTSGMPDAALVDDRLHG